MGKGINRRRFLGAVATLGSTAVLGRTARAATQFRGHPDAYGVLTDLTLCVGCRSCERACNEENRLPAPSTPFDDGSVFDETRRPTHRAYTVVNRYPHPGEPARKVYRKVQCNHCMEPACLTSCPIHAYTKTPEGAVAYDPDLCFGCRYCMTACPFYVPAYDYWNAWEPRIRKCTMCLPRIRAGKATACAEACPAGALTFGKRQELLRIAHKKIEESPGKYVNHVYGEHEVGGTNWLYLSDVPFERLDFQTDLPSQPLIEETKGFLAAVPVVLTAWPALFGTIYAALRHREEAKGEEDRP